MPTTTATRPRLALLPRHLQALERHAASAYPEECCGFLLGVEDGDGGTLVERALPARNEHPEDPRHRFLIAPETVLAARREARGLGLDIVGYYHSHPDLPAEPSERDLEHAWPNVSYLIVPVADGVPGAVRSWRLRDGGGFEEEVVETAGGPAVARHRRRAR